ncbi:MAG TPA: hypothetical protein VFL90_20800, partial [Methylomirabilota bacterium]|nr:hypothetical protein [Methylomirabilota bacterium]
MRLRRRTVARVALLLGAVAALLYPIPLQIQGTTYYETVGFLVLINAMLGLGWNVIGGWAGQFDFGPQVFFGIGAYTAALLYVKLGIDAWLGLLAGVAAAAVICAVLTYPLTRLRGHYFAISTVAIWMIVQPIGTTWEYIGAAQGLFIPMKTHSSIAGAILANFFATYPQVGLQFTVLAYAIVALGGFGSILGTLLAA